MKGKKLDKNIVVNGEGLTMWFETNIAKYPNSRVAQHLEQIYRMMTGDSAFIDTDLKTFLEKEINNRKEQENVE